MAVKLGGRTETRQDRNSVNTPLSKASWQRKGLFGLHFRMVVHHAGKSGQQLKQGRNLKAGIDAEATEGYCSLAFTPQLVQPTFSQNPQPAVQG